MRRIVSLVFALGLAAGAPAVAKDQALSATSTQIIVGTLVKEEDAGYPFARLTVQAPGQGPKEYLINQEEAEIARDADGNRVEMAGKKVRLVLHTKTVANARQIIRNGLNLDTEKKPVRAKKPAKGELTITGILSGADATQGDVAPVLTVTAKDGKKIDFDMFAMPPVVKANGKQVTLVYAWGRETRVMELALAK